MELSILWPFGNSFFYQACFPGSPMLFVSVLHLNLLLTNTPLVWVDHILFIHLLVDGPLGGFYFWLLWKLLWTFMCRIFNFLNYMPRSGITDLHINSGFNILKNWVTVFQNGHKILQSDQQCMGFQFLHILTIVCLFDSSHSRGSKVIISGF